MDMSISYTSTLMSHEIVQQALEELPDVFDLQTFNKILSEKIPADLLSIIGISSFQKNRIPIQWERKGIDLYTTKAKRVSLPQLLAAWTEDRCYLSYATALAEHGLSERKKLNAIYLSQDLHIRKKEDRDIDLTAMTRSFSQSPRVSNCCGVLKTRKFYFIEKKVGSEGITRKEVTFASCKVALPMTNIERSLLDATISPFYSGGLQVVLEAYKEAKIDLKRLGSIYASLSLAYPYWQRVGLLLELSGKSDIAKKWLQAFGKPAYDFYMDHNFVKNWNYDKKWKIFYPPLY